SIENITLENSNIQKVKEEFKTQSPNSLALKPQCKPILKKRSKREWVIVDKNKENQPIIGRVMTKRTHITDIICYESSSKNKKQTGERSSNKVFQERLSNRVKRARTEKLIDISPWVKYTKGEINLQLKPNYFVKQEKESSISSEQVRSLQSRKEEIRVVIEEPIKKVLGEPRIQEWIKISNPTILGVIKVVAQSKELEVILEKVKAHSGVKQNERADRIAKKGGEVDVPTRVKQVMTEDMIFWPVWKGIEIERIYKAVINDGC
ncbi:37046_t:CDS:2, partial [Gigaspora margarita]